MCPLAAGAQKKPGLDRINPELPMCHIFLNPLMATETKKYIQIRSRKQVTEEITASSSTTHAKEVALVPAMHCAHPTNR